MADRSVSVKLGANVQGFVTGMRTAQKATEDLVGKGLDRVAEKSSAITSLSNTAGIMGAGLVAAAGAAVAAFANFDQAMSSVEAATHESAENMELLREAAIRAGADTAFSATEAAAGIEELAKAGVSTADILGGGLTGALDLAAAGGIGVAEAAETAASAMTQFGLAGSDVTHIADLLAAGAGKAQGGVSDLSAALNQSGLVAAQTGLSIEETVGTLSMFASAGMIGSDAGTSFKTMLMALTPSSKKAADTMAELGISAYDTQGNFIGMSQFAGQLQGALGDLTVEQQNATLKTIFGADATRAASIIFKEGSAGVDQWTSAVNDAGYAAETAAIMMDNLKGDWEEFTGALETALIGAGEGANGPLRELVQNATEVVRAFSDLPPVVQQSTVAIAGGAGLALLGVAGIGRLVVALAEAKAAVVALGLTADATKVKMMALGKVLGALGVIVVANELMKFVGASQAAQVSAEQLATDLEALAAGAEAAGPALADLFQEGADWSPFRKEIQTTEDAITQFTASAREALGRNFWDQVDRFLGGAGDVAKFREEAEQLDAQLAEMDAAEARRAFETLTRDMEAAGVPLEVLMEMFPQYEGLISSAADETVSAASAQLQLEAAADNAAASMENQLEAVNDLIDSLSELYGNVLSARDAERALEASFDDLTESLKDNGNTMDITTEKGRANQQALDDVAKSSWDVIDAMAANGATAGELQGKMSTLRDRFIAAATAALGNADAAEALADELGLIPENVNTHVSTSGIPEAMSAVDGLVRYINNQSGTVKIYQQVMNNPNIGNTGGAGPGAGLIRQGGMATGGPVVGPGTGTSDSVPAWLSNGEYVIKADSVAKYGRSFFDAVNSQRFAAGGYVGGSNTTNHVDSGVVVHQTNHNYGPDADAVAQRSTRRLRDAIAGAGIGGYVG